VFSHNHKFRTKIVLGEFSVKLRREDTFKQTIGNECLYDDSNDNCLRVVNFATSNT
jgi:hypothetical protein